MAEEWLPRLHRPLILNSSTRQLGSGEREELIKLKKIKLEIFFFFLRKNLKLEKQVVLGVPAHH